MALIAIHPDVRESFSYLSDVEYLALFVVLEHALVVVKVLIMLLIPNESAAVAHAKQRYKYESVEALKKLVRNILFKLY